MKIKPIFAWYDLWVGLFWDRRNRCLYILPIPMIGVCIEFALLEIKREEDSAPLAQPQSARTNDTTGQAEQQ
jgi:hypothetical protein